MILNRFETDHEGRLAARVSELEQQLRGANAQLEEMRHREHSCYTALGAPCPSDEALPILIERRMKEARALVAILVDLIEFNDDDEDTKAKDQAIKRANEFLSLVTGGD